VILQNNTLSPNVRARDIAKEAIKGSIPEDEARLAIAGVIESANIPAEVARETFGITSRNRMDLTSLLSDMLVGRATGTGGFRKDLDLDRIASGDFDVMGWARQLLRTARPSKMRDLRLVDSRDILTAPTNPLREGAYDAVNVRYHEADALSVEQTIADTRFNHSLDALADAKGMRQSGLNRKNAGQLRAAYQIDAPIVVPEAVADRDWVLSTLLADEDDTVEELKLKQLVAYSSLTAWIAVVTGQGRRSNIDDRLLGLWDDFTVEQAEDLAEYRPAFAHTIALGAVTLIPKPSRDVVNAATKLATMAAVGHGWEAHVSDLMQSWLARECAPFSEFSSKPLAGETVSVEKARQDADSAARAAGLSDEAIADAVSAAELQARTNARDAFLLERAEMASMWPALVLATTRWHKAPFGKSEESVSGFVRRFLEASDPINFGS
jgi:hypothetical protein